MAERHEFVVIGAGVLGLSVARELARRGRDVVCLEQASVGHERAGSKGRARILRAGYHDPKYVRLATQVLGSWEQLEEDAGRPLIVPSGLVSCGARLDELLEAMDLGGAPAELMTGEAVRERFPGLVVPGEAVFEKDAGVLLADEVLRALIDTGPVRVLEHHVVTGIAEHDDSVTIEAAEYCAPPWPGADRASEVAARVGAGEGELWEDDDCVGKVRSFECRVAVLCCGPWSAAIARMGGWAALAEALWASLQQVVYVKLPGDVAERLPAVVWYRESGVAYGLPSPSDATYKVGLHDPGAKVEPAAVSLADDPSDLAVLSAVIAGLLPGADAERVATERCFYDNAPGQNFVLDRLGRLVVGAGTSGHGFKFAPLVGGVLADLAEGKQPAIPLDSFSVRSSSRLGT